MKRKQITTIAEAIKRLEKEQKDYYGFYRLTNDIIEATVRPIFDFYIKEIERCLALIVQKNITSKYTYRAEINHIKRFAFSIELDKEVFYQDKWPIGIPITEAEIKRDCSAWDFYSIGSLIDCLKELQDYFKYIENEGLKQVVSCQHIDDLPY